MLSIKKYSAAYIQDCRQKIAMNLATFDQFTDPDVSLCQGYFANLLLTLEHMFSHMLRSPNAQYPALMEVGLLADAIANNKLILQGDELGLYDATESILKIQIGQPVAINKEGFLRLSRAFFKEVEQKIRE